MTDESYLTTHEAALAVVATAMKKARLRLDTLVVNSFMGGILFTLGGMLHVLVQAMCPEMHASNPGLTQLIQGALYPIGLFYVVIMGVDLFNSNILFFSVALCRRAVGFTDLFVSWFVSWWFNLLGNIFVCYIFCHYSHISTTKLFVTGSQDILMQKAEFSFVETLIKGMAGNFFVCLAIYLQLMAKPLHVKFLMMALPIFTFVAMGFTHSVADMYMLVIGLINKAPISVGTVAWKIFLPGALGNMIGGSFFGVVIPWYLHIVVVERDQRQLNLPKFEVRDEQPELNQDSRVVRVPTNEKVYDENFSDPGPEPQMYLSLTRTSSIATNMTARTRTRSPANVFPVYGMGPPLEREQSIASGRIDTPDNISLQTAQSEQDPPASAEYIGDHLRRAFTRRQSRNDIESQRSNHSSRPPSLKYSFRNNLKERSNLASDLTRTATQATQRRVSRLAAGQFSPIEERSNTQTPVDISGAHSPEIKLGSTSQLDDSDTPNDSLRISAYSPTNT